jgi:hypothetical protein
LLPLLLLLLLLLRLLLRMPRRLLRLLVLLHRCTMLLLLLLRPASFPLQLAGARLTVSPLRRVAPRAASRHIRCRCRIVLAKL